MTLEGIQALIVDIVEEHDFCGQTRCLEEGADKYFVPQKCSNHVIGQNRFLEEGAEQYFVPQKFSNHVLGQNRFLEEGAEK